MDRSINPVFQQGRAVVERVLDPAGYELADEWHSPQSFGSAYVHYRNGHRRVKLIWDGKEGFLILRGATTPNAALDPWAWEPLIDRASPLALKPGPEANVWIDALRGALARFVGAAT